jgi:diguanylate cyclase (GGDEF)-like protein
MNASAKSGTTMLSAPVVMPDLPGNPASPAIFMFQPLYKAAPTTTGAKASEATAEPKKISGWVFGVFRVDEMLSKTLDPMPLNMGLKVYQGASTAQAAPIYQIDSSQSLLANNLKPIDVLVPIELDGQTLTLQFEGLPRAYVGGQGAVSRDLIAILMICGLFGVSAVLGTLMLDRSRKLAKLAEELIQSNDRYQFLATHDALTKVANRVLFQRTIDKMVIDSERYEKQFSLIYIDLDKFKQINDKLGHEAGDLVLIEATRRMVDTLRESDMVARRGGDEFVVLLPHIGDLEKVALVAQKICNVLAMPINLGATEGSIAGSLGIARYPYDGKTSETLVQQADQRMYLAKQQGGNCWVATDEAQSISNL